MKKRYECILLYNPNLDDESLKKEIANFEGLISNNGGSILNKSIPKKIEMGYIIKKKKEGHYIVIDFEIVADKIKELDSTLRLNDSILRFTFIVKQEKEAVL